MSGVDDVGERQCFEQTLLRLLIVGRQIKDIACHSIFRASHRIACKKLISDKQPN